MSTHVENTRLPAFPSNPHDHFIPTKLATRTKAPEVMPPGGSDVERKFCELTNKLNIITYK
jgi:hypothetical protein